MRKTVFYFLAAVFLLSAVALSSSPASAVSGPASKILTITPATTKPTIQPGESKNSKFQIINQGTADYPVHVYAAPYTVHSEAYTPDFTPVKGKLNPSSWIHFTVSDANITPNQTLDVNYTITVPSGTAPGGYYAVAFAETKSPGSGKQGVIINERVGEIFYIQVAGKVHQAGKLLTWSSNFWQKQPLGATLRLENDGSIDYASDIHITVGDLFGRAKYVFATQKEVLPQTIRNIPVTWDHTPPLGLFKVTGTATVSGKTVGLHTHYVLVVSPTFRTIGLALVAMLLAYSFGRKFGHLARRTKKTIE